jgi:hypothetical protein
MIKVGDIVFLKRKGGLMNNQPLTSQLGLVIKDYKEKGAITQFYVQFNQNKPKWYYQHNLHKIDMRKEKS